MIARISWLRLAGVMAVLVIFAILQRSPELSWFGVRPNIILSLMVVLGFVVGDFFVYAALAFIAVALIGPAKGFSFEELILLLLFFGLYFVRRYVPMHPLFSAVLLTSGGTLLWYLIVDPGFIAADFIAVLIEMFYNAVIAVLAYLGFERAFPHGKTSLVAF